MYACSNHASVLVSCILVKMQSAIICMIAFVSFSIRLCLQLRQVFRHHCIRSDLLCRLASQHRSETHKSSTASASSQHFGCKSLSFSSSPKAMPAHTPGVKPQVSTNCFWFIFLRNPRVVSRQALHFIKILPHTSSVPFNSQTWDLAMKTLHSSVRQPAKLLPLPFWDASSRNSHHHPA